jgi:cytochrome c-type biogenesis protein
MQQVEEQAIGARQTITLANRLQILLHAVMFVIGFSFVFIVGWGGAATALGSLLYDLKDWITRIGGVVLILFGLATMNVIRIPWFYMDTRPAYRGKTGTFWGSLLMGVFFAAGWSPCIGATLGAILTLGFSQNTVGQAMVLTSGYSLGFGLMFLLLALGLDRAMVWVRRMRKHMRTFQIVTGLLVIGIGILMLTERMTLISQWAQSTGLYLDLPSNGSAIPSYLTAIVAGVLSFFSPCVLPLVPAYLGYLGGQALTAVKGT